MASAGRKAVVTGAASGIGRAATERLRGEGVEVLAVDVDARAPERSRRARLRGVRRRSRAIPGSASGLQPPRAASIISSTPPACCASSRSSKSPWRNGGPRRSSTQNRVFFLCQLIGARLNPGGAVVNLSSSSAKLATSVDVAAYAASKTTILSITRSFAYALARPSAFGSTRFVPALSRRRCSSDSFPASPPKRGITAAEFDAQRKKAVPLGRGASAEECAGLISFLLSDAAAYMTGQAINFTGGLVNW